jgi:ABC-type oligopeptide transport system substrate-binding subunit
MKKILLATLTIALALTALSLTACGNGDDTEQTTTVGGKTVTKQSGVTTQQLTPPLVISILRMGILIT